MLGSGHDALEVKQRAFDLFNARLDERLAVTVWSTPGVSSSFKNSKGRVRSVSPWRIEEYWRMTRDLDEQDYEFS
jgi:4-hydroxyacetophenone monooxygenase